MTLVCPVFTPPTFESVCAGHFISGDELHLVWTEGHDLVFEQLLPKTNAPPLRVPAAVNYRIAGLYRVPLPSSAALAAQDPPDMLLIHTQTKPSNAPAISHPPPLENRLHFKQYDAQAQELRTVSSVTLFASDAYDTSCLVSVCVNGGPLQGTVALALDKGRSLYVVDPRDAERAVSVSGDDAHARLPRTESLAESLAESLHWATDDSLVVAGPGAGFASKHHELTFYKVQRPPRSSPQSFELSRFGHASLPAEVSVRCIGPGPSADGGISTAVAILSDGTVQLYACSEAYAVLVATQELNIPEPDERVYRNLPTNERFDYRKWTVLASPRATEAYFVANDAVVLKVEHAGPKLTTFKLDALPAHAALRARGLGVFEVHTGMTNDVQLVQMRADGGSRSRPVRCEFLRPRPCEFHYGRLIKQDRDAFFGRRFWFTVWDYTLDDGRITTELHIVERTLPARLWPMQAYPISAPLCGVWYIGERRLVVSSEKPNQTATYEIDGLRLRRVASCYDGDFVTLAAGPGIQVTRDAIVFAGGSLTVSLLRSGAAAAAAAAAATPAAAAAAAAAASTAVCAAIDGPRVAVARAHDVLLVADTHVVLELGFDELIVGVDCRASLVAVCTVSALHIMAYGSREQQVYALRALPTSVACGPNGRVYVGDIAGDVFMWPEAGYAKVAYSPIKRLCGQSDGVAVLAGLDESAFIDADGKFMRLPVGDASDVVVVSDGAAATQVGVALVGGVLQCLDIGASPSMLPRRIEAFKRLHSSFEHVRFCGDFVYSFELCGAQSKKLRRAPLLNIAETQQFDLPEMGPGYSNLFMVSETQFVEFCDKSRAGEGEASDAEDWMDDAAEVEAAEEEDARYMRNGVPVVARLYELEPDSPRVKVLDEVQFHTGSDPSCLNLEREFVVKPYSPTKFILLAPNVSTVAVSAVPRHNPRALKVRKRRRLYRNARDDHWVGAAHSGTMTIVSTEGQVFTVGGRKLGETSQNGDENLKLVTELGRVTKEGDGYGVSKVLLIRGSEGKDPHLITASRRMYDDTSSEVLLAAVRQDDLVDVARLRAHCPNPTFVDAGEQERRMMSGRDARSPALRRASLFSPGIAIGTDYGGIYLLSFVNDDAVASALREVEKVLRQSIEIVDNDVTSDDDKTSIDGALLMQALRMPEAESVFAAAGLDAAELRQALDAML